MGPRNSSDTRVQPVFDELLDRHWRDGVSAGWLVTLWGLAKGARDACPAPPDIGQLREADARVTAPRGSVRSSSAASRPRTGSWRGCFSTQPR